MNGEWTWSWGPIAYAAPRDGFIRPGVYLLLRKPRRIFPLQMHKDTVEALIRRGRR